jgi:nucleoid-associated protein YgaU
MTRNLGLAQAAMQPLNTDLVAIGEAVSVMFNPAELNLDEGNQFQSTAIPGLSTPLTQFISGNARTLIMDLFFDSYEMNIDVRNFTNAVTDMLSINNDLHAPPICKFIFGKFDFIGVLEKATQKFTMFSGDGMPVRASINISLKEYKPLTMQYSDTPRESADLTKSWRLSSSDRLESIAAAEYDNPKYWIEIAKANNIDNPRKLKAGTKLTLPPLE